MSRSSRLTHALGITLGAAGLAGAGLLIALRRSLPRTSGTLTLPGLRQRVEVLRDKWGVPHIYAASNEDLFMALGYVHAQDRLWQMELNRHTAHGRLAELFGPLGIETDRLVRVLGFSRIAQREVELLDDHTRTIVEAYVRGINTFLETHTHRLPIECLLLRHHPTPWNAADVLVWSKIIALNLTNTWPSKLLHAHLGALADDELAQALMHCYPDTHPLTIPPDGTANSLPPFINPHIFGQGSNAWVVSGERTASGKPMLANDPHLVIALPSLWYEAHLEGGDYRVTGVTFPGMPPVIIGHNAHIAWGITNAMTDVQDLYIERFDPHTPRCYEYQGTWHQAERVRETINVRGRSQPVIEEVRITHHGPIISPIIAPPDSPIHPAAPPHPSSDPSSPYEEVLALRWTALEPGQIANAGLAMNRARTWDEFRNAIASWNAPAQNFLYADTDGHYGYILAGDIPIRAQGNGRVPVPGWTGTYEWQGYIPTSDLPATFDPPEGIAYNANNRIVDDTHPYSASIQGNWFNGYRAARIRQLLDATPRHTVESFARMQQDQLSLPGLQLAQAIADIPLHDPLEQQARTLLLDWDGMLSADSIGGAIYALLRHYLEHNAFSYLNTLAGARAGSGIFGVFPYENMLDRRLLPTLLERIAAERAGNDPDPWLPAGETWEHILQHAFGTAVAELRSHMGNNPHEWHYGRIHSIKMQHPLGMIPGLSLIFNRGPWPVGGDVDTICMGYFPRRNTATQLYIAPSYRQICDTGNWDASCSIIASGQSGHPASRHYCDMARAWLDGSYHPMAWSRTQVEQHTVATVTLEPIHGNE